MWKEAVAAQFKVLSWHLPGGTKETRETLNQDSRFSGQDSNPRPPEYEAATIFNTLNSNRSQIAALRLLEVFLSPPTRIPSKICKHAWTGPSVGVTQIFSRLSLRATSVNNIKLITGRQQFTADIFNTRNKT
jgi:hypothetical protein